MAELNVWLDCIRGQFSRLNCCGLFGIVEPQWLCWHSRVKLKSLSFFFLFFSSISLPLYFSPSSSFFPSLPPPPPFPLFLSSFLFIPSFLPPPMCHFLSVSLLWAPGVSDTPVARVENCSFSSPKPVSVLSQVTLNKLPNFCLSLCVCKWNKIISCPCSWLF